MKVLTIAALLAATTSGCSKRKLSWSDRRAPSMAVDGFTVDVPAGWRDAAEAKDDDMKQLLAKQVGWRALVREDFDGATILVKSGANAPTAEPACTEIANGAAKQDGGTATNVVAGKVDGDATCQWITTKGELRADYWTRFHADKLAVILCAGPGPDLGATCAQVRASVRPTK